MPLQRSFGSARASGLRVILPPPLSKEIVLLPPSMAQLAAVLALDPAADAPKETSREKINRQVRQAEILLGEHAGLTSQLTEVQVGEIVLALYLTAKGIDPANVLAVQEFLREQHEAQRSSEETLASLENLILNLAAELRTLPGDVAQMPVEDGLALYERLGKLAHEEFKFQAALHGRKLL